MHPDHRAILTICAGVLLLVCNDALAKSLVGTLDPFRIIFFRSLLALPMIAAAALWLRGPRGLRTHGLGIHILRAALAIVATFCFFTSLRTLPLAEATSLIFAAPLFVAVLSMPLLRQRVGPRRGLAVAAGFAGVLIVLQPGAQTLQPASLLALAAAFIHALVMMSARWIDRRDGFWVMTFYMVLFSALGSSFTLALDAPPLRPIDLGALFGMAVLGTLGIALISHAFRMADAAVVAPFDYTALIWATLFGLVFWGAVPGPMVYLGAAVIIASGWFLIASEGRRET